MVRGLGMMMDADIEDIFTLEVGNKPIGNLPVGQMSRSSSAVTAFNIV